MNRFYLFVLCLGILIPQNAHAENAFSKFLRGLLQEDTTPKPEDTLQAPFATDSTVKAPQNNLMTIYDAGKNADATSSAVAPHVTINFVRDWVTQAVADALTIDLAQPEMQKKSALVFEPYGLQEYQTWLQSSNITAVMNEQKITLHAVAAGDPILLSEGALDGTYRWLFDVPVIMSYYDRGLKTLKTTASVPQSQTVKIRVQVGRMKDSSDKRIMIERWSSAS